MSETLLASAFDPFAYRGRLKKIVDGDTYELEVDLGFNTTRTVTVRADGIDTAETWFTDEDSEEYRRGQIHEDFVTHWFAIAEEDHDGEWPLIVDTRKNDGKGKYGRYLAEVVRQCDGREVTADLEEEFGEEVVY